MVVLDAVHAVQAMHSPDLAVRWNCKAGKCGSCSGEVNGKPRLMCMDRMDKYPAGRADHDSADEDVPGDEGSGLRRVVELQRQQEDSAVQDAPDEADEPDASRRKKRIACRNSASASSASCARTCATCCATTRSKPSSPARGSLVRVASLEMHPLDTGDRLELVKDELGLGLLQHHEVLHGSLPGAHQDHRQRDHPAQGAGGGSLLRSGEEAAADCVSEEREGWARFLRYRVSKWLELKPSRSVSALTIG